MTAFSGRLKDKKIQPKEIFETVKHVIDRDESRVLTVDDRIYDKDSDGKTKNTYCLKVLKLSHNRGFYPQVVVMDVCYSSLKNVKSIRDSGLHFVTDLRNNRKVNRNISLEDLLENRNLS